MSVTTELKSEMARCLRALNDYEKSRVDMQNPAHATAYRATMDVTRLLAKWRKTPPVWTGVK